MHALLVITTLYWTNPAFGADTILCGSTNHEIHDLEAIRIHAFRRYARTDSVVTLPGQGREGRGDSLRFDLGMDTWTFWATWTDTAGNESCPSNRLVVNAPNLAVPPAPWAAPLEWYDLEGRALTAPLGPGVYFRRRGTVVERVILLR